MNWFQDFLIKNFILLCVALIMIVISIQRYRQHPKVSLYSILIMGCVLALAISATLEAFCKSIANPTATLVFAIIGYALRPVCIFLFILLSGVSTKNRLFFLTAVPLIVNFLIYCLGFIPGAQQLVVYFEPNDSGGISFVSGPLRFASHIVSLGYLLWLAYLSLRMLRLHHLSHGLAIMGCAVFVVLAVVMETFVSDGEVYLLNSTIAVSALFYYLYLYIERTQTDTLTGLYNRETYYVDTRKMDRIITGVIQFDMNGLKFINDNFGHFEGDKALQCIASLILQSANNKMYVYRLGGDEFLLLAIGCTEQELTQTVEQFNKLIAETQYHCSVGYSFRKDDSTTVHDLMVDAETKMYEAKKQFYSSSTLNRRKG